MITATIIGHKRIRDRKVKILYTAKTSTGMISIPFDARFYAEKWAENLGCTTLIVAGIP